jgi:hypothetical protein
MSIPVGGLDPVWLLIHPPQDQSELLSEIFR